MFYLSILAILSKTARNDEHAWISLFDRDLLPPTLFRVRLFWLIAGCLFNSVSWADLGLTPEEKEWVAQHTTIKVMALKDWPLRLPGR